MPEEIIAIALIAVIIVAAVLYIVKAKKSGRKCIGCPDGVKCSKEKGCCGGCSSSCGCEKSAQEQANKEQK